MGYRPYREQIAAVMQEDQLLSGSVADNICLFDPSFDQKRMVFAARLACVDDEIMRMPMACNSLIGDMGSSLSGGQKQRVLLEAVTDRAPSSPKFWSMTDARKHYLSDVSDEEWALIAPYLTMLSEEAGQRQHSLREVFNDLPWFPWTPTGNFELEVFDGSAGDEA